jgi:hypothetical protein
LESVLDSQTVGGTPVKVDFVAIVANISAVDQTVAADSFALSVDQSVKTGTADDALRDVQIIALNTKRVSARHRCTVWC